MGLAGLIQSWTCRGGLTSGCCLGLVRQPERRRLEGDTGAPEGAGLFCCAEPQGHLRKIWEDPASSGARGTHRIGSCPFGLEVVAVGSQEVGQEAHRSLIGMVKEMRQKEAGSGAQALRREGGGCPA